MACRRALACLRSTTHCLQDSIPMLYIKTSLRRRCLSRRRLRRKLALHTILPPSLLLAPAAVRRVLAKRAAGEQGRQVPNAGCSSHVRAGHAVLLRFRAAPAFRYAGAQQAAETAITPARRRRREERATWDTNTNKLLRYPGVDAQGGCLPSPLCRYTLPLAAAVVRLRQAAGAAVKALLCVFLPTPTHCYYPCLPSRCLGMLYRCLWRTVPALFSISTPGATRCTDKPAGKRPLAPGWRKRCRAHLYSPRRKRHAPPAGRAVGRAYRSTLTAPWRREDRRQRRLAGERATGVQ